MSWQKKKIGEIITLQRGHDLPSSQRIEGDVPIISSSGTTDYHNEFKYDGEGVVTGRYGTLGEVFYVNGKYWPLNTTLFVKDFKGNIPKFIYYYLKTIHLERFNGAAAVPGLDRNVLHRIEVLFPTDINTQQNIASILSAYDDLIENNNQRIKLLEEMAEEIYKEWFVRLRFPGHKESRVFNGIPEGWENGKLEEMVQINKGKNITKSTIQEGTVPVVAGGIEPAYFHNTPNTISPTITVSASGANAGYVNLYYQNIWASDCSFIDKTLTENVFFFFSLLKHRQKEIFHLQKGSAQPHVYPKDLMKIKLTIPSNELISQYEKEIGIFYQEIGVLNSKNRLLQQTRDLLLPRLISGKLSVEVLEQEEDVTLNMAAEPREEYNKI